jgi:prepilin-type processing-associated H-X9-DG protein
MSWSAWLGVLALAVVALVVAWWAKRGLAFSTWLFVVALLIGFLVVTGLPSSRVTQPRTQCSNNLRAIMSALQQYHDIHKTLPPATLIDGNGKPMHSWRVLILPYLGERDLYDEYRFDEPWDGPNNRRLWQAIPQVYQCRARKRGLSDVTSDYAAVTGQHTSWETGLSEDEAFGSRERNGALIVEAANSGINWMEPRDLDVSQVPMAINSPSGVIASVHGQGAHFAFADGAVVFVKSNLSKASIRKLLSCDDQ